MSRTAAARAAAVRRAALAIALAAALSTCDGSATSPAGVDTGRADLSRYVAIGNSLTAGFSSGALYESAQRCSFPALIAERAGVGPFVQPLAPDPGISKPGSEEGRLELTSLEPLTIERVAGPAVVRPSNADHPRPYDNLGVPGALGVEALVARDRATSREENRFFEFVFRGRGTWLDQARRLDPTFLTVWLGSNDVLAYATRGGEFEGFPIPVEEWDRAYTTFLDELLAATDADVVLVNVPDVASVPFLTAIPPVVLDLGTLEPRPGPDGDPIPLIGPDGPLDPSDLVTLDAAERIVEGEGVPVSAGGTGEPLPGRVILDASEQAVVDVAVQGYNAVIDRIATERDLVVVDARAFLRDVADGGIESDGRVLTDRYPFGGMFSLDGIHPTCRGYGAVANEIIDTINARFGASIPAVSTRDLPGVQGAASARGPEPRSSAARWPTFHDLREIPRPF